MDLGLLRGRPIVTFAVTLLRLLRLQLVVKAQLPVRLQGGAHLRVCQRLATRVCDKRVVDVASDQEHPFVRRTPLIEDAVLCAQIHIRACPKLAQAHLKPALWIEPLARFDLLGREGEEDSVRKGPNKRHAERLPIEEERTNERLEAVCEHSAARAALHLRDILLESQAVVHARRNGDFAELRIVDKRLAEDGERALLAFGEMMEQIVGGGEAEHRVAKPLEASVARVGVSPTHLVAL